MCELCIQKNNQIPRLMLYCGLRFPHVLLFCFYVWLFVCLTKGYSVKNNQSFLISTFPLMLIGHYYNVQ